MTYNKWFRYNWPSRKREMDVVLKADPQVKPPRKCDSEGESGIEREVREVTEQDVEFLRKVGARDV